VRTLVLEAAVLVGAVEVPAGVVAATAGSGTCIRRTSVNYMSWSIRVQAIMEDQGVWEVIEPSEGTEATAEGQAAAAAKLAKDRKAKAHLL
jgi:hypothetical protein